MTTSIRLTLFSILMGLIFSFSPDASYGSEQKALVFALQKQKNPAELTRSGNAIAEALSTELGREVKVLVPSDYSATVQALVSGHADVGYVSSLPFLLAERDGGAELLLVEERQDNRGEWRTHYDSVLVARADGKLKTIKDILANAQSLRLVFTSHTSTSGYVFPFAFFREQGLLTQGQKPEDKFAQVRYAGGYSQALQQVLVGNADIAAVSGYTVEGKKSAVYISPEERNKLMVVARISGVPTHIIATRSGFNPKDRSAIAGALIKISQEKPELLEQVYGTARFVNADKADHLKATRKAIADTGLPIHGLVK
jgi:phosphonate transport system substrate-binding protein